MHGVVCLVVVLGTGIQLARPLAAHDMWLEPSSFSPAVGDLVGVGLHVGHGDGEGVARDPRHGLLFVAVGPGGEQPLVGIDGQHPAGHFRPETPGSFAVVYVSDYSDSVLPAARFEKYLEEKGLRSVLDQRRGAGRYPEPGRERFARSLKSLLRVDSAAAIVDRALGLPLEFVLSSRGGSSTSKAVELLLLAHGQPLSQSLVEVRSLRHGERTLTGRTDTSGKARFELGPGAWLVTAVHMMTSDSATADWESIWTSLTFELSDV